MYKKYFIYQMHFINISVLIVVINQYDIIYQVQTTKYALDFETGSYKFGSHNAIFGSSSVAACWLLRLQVYQSINIIMVHIIKSSWFIPSTSSATKDGCFYNHDIIGLTKFLFQPWVVLWRP
jgi:hypothetical protein